MARDRLGRDPVYPVGSAVQSPLHEERYDERQRNDRNEGKDQRAPRQDLEHSEGDDLGHQYQRYEQPEHHCGYLSATFVGTISLSFVRRFGKNHLTDWYGC
jgi:hypothetical protein